MQPSLLGRLFPSKTLNASNRGPAVVSETATSTRSISDIDPSVQKIFPLRLRNTLGRKYWRLAFISAVLVLIIVRAPFLLIHPRIWAEEGVYLNFALHHSVLQGLVHLYLPSGYYVFSANFPATVAALVSKWWGLEYASFVTTYFSLCLQMLPFAVLIYGKSHLFWNLPSKFIACLLILLAPTTSGEIWLNTINSISWTGLAAVIIVFEDTSTYSRKTRALLRLLLVFCGTCGPYAAITFPLFLFSYLVYREREKLIQATILFLCCILQAGILGYVKHLGGANLRLASFTVDSAIVNIFFFHVVGAVAGDHGATAVFNHCGLTDSLQKSLAIPRGGPVLLAAYFCALVLILLLLGLWDKKLWSQKTLLIGTFLSFTVLTAVASAWGIPHHRYAFLPGISLLFLIWANARQNRSRLIQLVCWILLACAIWSGARDYRQFWLGFRASCPPWSEEVQRWRANHAYRLQVWPPVPYAYVEWSPKPRSLTHN